MPGDHSRPGSWSVQDKLAVVTARAALNALELSEYCGEKRVVSGAGRQLTSRCAQGLRAGRASATATNQQSQRKSMQD